MWSSAAVWQQCGQVSVIHIKRCDKSCKYSQIAGTFEGTVCGASPLTLKSANVLSGAPALASVPLGLGMSCVVPSGDVDG